MVKYDDIFAFYLLTQTYFYLKFDSSFVFVKLLIYFYPFLVFFAVVLHVYFCVCLNMLHNLSSMKTNWISFPYYTCNLRVCKRVEWLLFKRVKSVKTTLTKWKLLIKRVKIIPKWVKITPKRVKITPIEWISLFGEAHRGTALLFRAVPLCAPLKEIHSIGVIFTLFRVIFTHFGMIFTRFESDFHSVRVFLTFFTLLKSNHFTLFTLRE